MKIEIEEKRLRKRLAALAKFLPQGAAGAVRVTAVMFAQSANRATYPDAGKRSFSLKSTKREYVDVLDMRQKMGGARSPVWKKFSDEHDGARICVIWKDPASGKLGRKWFKEKGAEFKAFRVITYRGAARAGWWGALPKLGEPAPNFPKTVSAVQSFLARRNNITTVSSNRLSISIENRTRAIRPAPILYAERVGMQNANKRLNQYIRGLGVKIGKV